MVTVLNVAFEADELDSIFVVLVCCFIWNLYEGRVLFRRTDVLGDLVCNCLIYYCRMCYRLQGLA